MMKGKAKGKCVGLLIGFIDSLTQLIFNCVAQHSWSWVLNRAGRKNSTKEMTQTRRKTPDSYLSYLIQIKSYQVFFYVQYVADGESK